jgi:type II secretory pathway component PulC
LCANFAIGNQSSPSDKICNGYQILEKGSIQSQIGIKLGDVIKSFDGSSVDTPKMAMDLMSKLDSPGKHEVVFERNGKIEKIKYEVTKAFKQL